MLSTKFELLREEIITLHGLYNDYRAAKVRVIEVVKQVSAKATARDPEVIEGLACVFVEIFGAQCEGVNASCTSLLCVNGSAAAGFWRVIVALLPRVKAARDERHEKTATDKFCSVVTRFAAEGGLTERQAHDAVTLGFAKARAKAKAKK